MGRILAFSRNQKGQKLPLKPLDIRVVEAALRYNNIPPYLVNEITRLKNYIKERIL